jgi:two-component system KDP operon response regulator KdpE
MSQRVLLIEDDVQLRATLSEALRVEGYDVYCAASHAQAELFLERPPGGEFDLVLLDLGLPDREGADLLPRIRKKNALPVLIISASEQEGRKIGLLDAGADDYLVKPFSVGELLARMRVALRHRGVETQSAITQYEAGGVTVDLKTRRIERDGAQVHLTPTEFKLLARLVRSAGRVVTHRQLLADVWGQDFVEHTHYLRLYMAQLRAKLESDPAVPRLLFTEAGVGYRLRDGA